MRLGRGCFTAFAVLAALAWVGAVPAGATTFCVPSFHAACPSGGGNVARSDLERAISENGKDGIADMVLVAAGTFTETGAYEPEPGTTSTESFDPIGSDPLEVVGAGPESTVLTSSGTNNSYLVYLASNNSRRITIRDLTLRIPTTFTPGAGIYLDDEDTLDNVDIVGLSPGADGLVAGGEGNVFRNGEVSGAGAEGSIDNAFATALVGGQLLVEDSTVRGASWGLFTEEAGSVLTVRRLRQVNTRAYGAITDAGTISIQNSTFTIDDGIGLYVSPNAEDAALQADHLTVINEGGASPALEAKRFGSGAGDGSIVLSNSIMRGFGSGYRAETTIGPGIGFLEITARYSDIPAAGTNINGQIDFGTGNLDVDPLLAADLSLPATSPVVDAGDPALGGSVTDFLGAPRPVDGDGDGIARRDIGAFEYQPSVPEAPGGGGEAPTPDTTAPQTRIVSGPGKRLSKRRAVFRFRSSEPGSRFRCKLGGRKVVACKAPKRFRKLTPGRHVFRVWAIDAAGNKDPTAAMRRFRVRVG